MNDAILNLLVAALAFTGSHFALSSTALRVPLVRAFRERGFLLVYSLLAGVTFVWMVAAYAEAPRVVLWTPAAWSRWPAFVLVPVAVYLLLCGYTMRNPTAVMSPGGLPPAARVRGVMRITRHPVMWGIALWALSHIPPNGDAASLILFGAMAVLALGGAVHMEARERERRGQAWREFASVTSFLPLGALLSGRSAFSVADLGGWRVPVALAISAALAIFHDRLAGAPLL